MLLTIVVFLLVLSVLVLAHEWGHFFTARRFGVKAEEFGLGFPPRIGGIYKNQAGQWRLVWGDVPVENLENNPLANLRPAPRATIYSLNWLPIGGFVKIKGENGEGPDQGDSFSARKIWQRIVILTAGVVMNIILAWLLLSVGYMFGLPQSTDTLGPRARLSQSQVAIVEVMPNSPAAAAGLQAGDAIRRVNNVSVGTEKALQDAIAAQNGQTTELLIYRGGEEKIIKVVPTIRDGGRATIGVAIFSSGLVSYPFFSAIGEGAKTTVWILKQIVLGVVNLLGGIFHGQNVGDQFAGPVGIASITGQAARLGFVYLLQFTALLSLNLAVLNILPFPALDGGRVLFLLIEKIKGKPVRREVEAAIHNIGFLLLIALVLFITYKDIVKFF